MDVGTVYVDANVFIGAFEADGAVAEQAAYLISGMTRKNRSLVTSELTLAELLVLPFRRGDIRLATFYSGLLSSDGTIDVHLANRETFMLSERLRGGNTSLKLPDAVHLATAVLSGCTHMLTADRGIRSLGRPVILRPDEPTLTSLIESLSA